MEIFKIMRITLDVLAAIATVVLGVIAIGLQCKSIAMEKKANDERKDISLRQLKLAVQQMASREPKQNKDGSPLLNEEWLGHINYAIPLLDVGMSNEYLISKDITLQNLWTELHQKAFYIPKNLPSFPHTNDFGKEFTREEFNKLYGRIMFPYYEAYIKLKFHMWAFYKIQLLDPISHPDGLVKLLARYK